MMRTKLILATAASSMALSLAGAAVAQETLPPPSSIKDSPETVSQTPLPASPARGDQGDPAGAGGLEDIVVTAQRREQRLQDVPIAISVTTEARLAAVGIRNAQELTVVTPALTTSQSNAYFQPRLRGVGTTANGPLIENSVATYVDDVYIASAVGSIFSFNNISRVEVLKGPQGTLFGRNATGGLVHVVTKDPSRDAGGRLNVSYGNYDTIAADGYLTTGIGDSAAIDVAATTRFQRDGFGVNFATGRATNRVVRDIGVRSKLVWDPGETTTVRLLGDYSDAKGSYPAFRADDDTLPAFGPLPPGGPYDNNSDVDFLTAFHGGGVSLKIDQDVGDLKLVSISAWRRSQANIQFDFDLTPTRGISTTFGQKDRQFSQELQLQSGSSSAVNWVVGAYYFDAKASYNPFDFNVGADFRAPGRPLYPLIQRRITGDVTTESLAGFGQATVPLGSATNLTAGIRFTHEKRTISPQQVAIVAVAPAPVVQIAPGSLDRSTKFDKATWRVSLDHRFTSEVMVYASFNRGFKAGGYVLSTPDAAPFRPENLDAYEIGAKMELADRKVRFNPSLFYYDYTNLQVPIILPNGTNGIVNGPSAKIYGLDLDAEIAVSPGLVITGGISALHDRFGSFPQAVINAPVPAPGRGNSQVLGSATGNRIPYTADFVSSLGFNYTLEIEGGSKFDLNGNWNHNDGFFTAADNLRDQPSFDLFNASIGWTSADGALNAKLWGKNLSNEAVILSNNGATFATSIAYQPPRTYGVTVGVQF